MPCATRCGGKGEGTEFLPLSPTPPNPIRRIFLAELPVPTALWRPNGPARRRNVSSRLQMVKHGGAERVFQHGENFTRTAVINHPTMRGRPHEHRRNQRSHQQSTWHFVTKKSVLAGFFRKKIYSKAMVPFSGRGHASSPLPFCHQLST